MSDEKRSKLTLRSSKLQLDKKIDAGSLGSGNKSRSTVTVVKKRRVIRKDGEQAGPEETGTITPSSAEGRGGDGLTESERNARLKALERASSEESTAQADKKSGGEETQAITASDAPSSLSIIKKRKPAEEV